MIIAEIGLNHLGKEEFADLYVDTLLDSDVDAITFQIREDWFYKRTKYKNYRLSEEYYKKVSKKIRENKVKFGIALANIDPVNSTIKFNTDFYKLINKSILDFEVIDMLLSKTDKQIFASTGACNIDELDKFYNKIVKHKDRFNLVHTTLSKNIGEVNLKAINLLRDRYCLPVSFGSHCENYRVCYLSLPYEPSDILLYVKNDLPFDYPDNEHAIPLYKIKEVVKDLKTLPQTIGMPIKISINRGRLDT